MRIYNIYNKVLVCLVLLCLCPSRAFCDLICPSEYKTVDEDVIYISTTGSCPSGYTKLGGEHGEDTIENCIYALAEGKNICTFFKDDCQSGQYFDGMSHQTCIAGSYCDGSGVATPGTSGCSMTCPDGTTSDAGAIGKQECRSAVSLRIGDDIRMNLITTRPTTSPVMVFQISDTLYYSQMSNTETPINSETNTKYRVLYDNKEYWVHDYTVE